MTFSFGGVNFIGYLMAKTRRTESTSQLSFDESFRVLAGDLPRSRLMPLRFQRELDRLFNGAEYQC